MNIRAPGVVQACMKQIMVSLAALALLAVVVPQVEAGQRHRGGGHRSNHAISSFSGHHGVLVRHRYRRAYSNAYYRPRYYRPYYADPYYSPYYGGYSPYSYGFPGIALSFGGGHHHHGRHH